MVPVQLSTACLLVWPSALQLYANETGDTRQIKYIRSIAVIWTSVHQLAQLIGLWNTFLRIQGAPWSKVAHCIAASAALTAVLQALQQLPLPRPPSLRHAQFLDAGACSKAQQIMPNPVQKGQKLAALKA